MRMTTVTLALAGDTMLGRGVAEQLAAGVQPEELFAPELVEMTRSADLFVLNLECCISGRGERWPDPHKPFFFRAPPSAVRALTHIGVDCVTLANNHALDFGVDALRDTLEHLSRARIGVVGAGPELSAARAPAILSAGGFRLGVIGFADHPADFAAGRDRPGIAYADLGRSAPDWLLELVATTRAEVDALLVTPHWGPNMTPAPVQRVRRASRRLLEAGASLIAGHSAHVFHGIVERVIYDLGDFIDDYAVNPALRNDLGLLFLVELDEQGPRQLQAVPLRLDFCHTSLADGADAAWVRTRFTAACHAFGTQVTEEGGRLVVRWLRDQDRTAAGPG
jgi:hypothetical protein